MTTALWEAVPTNAIGNPDFQRFEDIAKVFNEEQIVALVNRALYAMNYQRETHAKLYVPKRQPKQVARRLVEGPFVEERRVETTRPTIEGEGEGHDKT